MDDCSNEDMAALAKAPRPRQKLAVGQAAPPGHEDWRLERLRGQPLPDAEAIVYVLAYARQQKLFVNVALGSSEHVPRLSSRDMRDTPCMTTFPSRKSPWAVVALGDQKRAPR